MPSTPFYQFSEWLLLTTVTVLIPNCTAVSNSVKWYQIPPSPAARPTSSISFPAPRVFTGLEASRRTRDETIESFYDTRIRYNLFDFGPWKGI